VFGNPVSLRKCFIVFFAVVIFFFYFIRCINGVFCQNGGPLLAGLQLTIASGFKFSKIAG